MTKTSFAYGQLRAIVERIERLEEEKKTIADDIKEVYAEAKGNGFDVKILRKVIALRKKEAAERSEEEAMIDIYLAAISGTTEIEEPDHGLIPQDAGHAGGVEHSPNRSPAAPIPELPRLTPVDVVMTAASDGLTEQQSYVVGEGGPSLAALRIPTISDFMAVL